MTVDRAETPEQVGEFEFIERIAAHGLVRPDDVLQGIGDDCAVVEAGDEEVLLVTTDMMVEDVHFRLDKSPPEGLGYKLLAVNLSDIAAMGGTPRDAFVSVGVPRGFDLGYVERVFTGLHAGCSRFRVNLLGGDTTSSPGPLILNLTMTGKMREDEVIYRSGGRPGDLLFVSGTLGDSAAGFRVLEGRGGRGLSDEDRAWLIRRHQRPEPRVALGRALAEAGPVTAMIDLSDGLASDLRHVCARSRVRGVVRPDALPLSPAFRRFCQARGCDAAGLAMSGGEDYEVLFSVDPESAGAVELLAHDAGISLTAVGRLERGDGVFEENARGTHPLSARGFDHFAPQG